MASLNPYVMANTSRRLGMPSSFGGYGGVMPGMGGNYGRYRPDLQGAVTGSVGSSSGADPEARAEGRAQFDQQHNQLIDASQANQEMSNELNEKNNARQAASIGAYRTARDNSQGAQDAREQKQMATSLGIDPSSSLKDITAAANGPATFDGNGMPTGGNTASTLTAPGEAPPPSQPGAVQPNETDVRNAVVTQQAAKDGTQARTQAGAYAGAASPTTGMPPTGASAFGASGIQPRTTAAPALRSADGVDQPVDLAGQPPGPPVPALGQAPAKPVAAATRTPAVAKPAAMPSTINSAFSGIRRKPPQSQSILRTP
jgi:hypothetical protein